MRNAWLLGLLAIGSSACADELGVDKGTEDAVLDDGKADTFFDPTDHGELSFGAHNRAEITADASFHAWTFTLTDTAEVSLRTVIEGNLDTVMYLYRRDIGSDNWGRFFLKNDDASEGELFSQIDFEGEAAEYRIIVKGFKRSHRGPFAVLGECVGNGCPSTEECSAPTFDPLPPTTGFTASCANALVRVATSTTLSTSSHEASEADVCALPDGLEDEVDLFRAYWDSILGWDDFTGGQELPFRVVRDQRASGRAVTVSYFDDGATTALYDENDRLIMLTADDQSPEMRWFCGAPGESEMSEPFGCFDNDMLNSMPHTADDVFANGTAQTTCSDSFDDALPLLVGDPVCEFTFAHGIGDEDPVDVEFTVWRAPFGLLGAEVVLTSGSASDTFYLGTTSLSTTMIYAVSNDEGTRFPCLEIR
jgi:hypothetical protein